jgi:predicted MFS family arabinose efflux permease
MRGLFWLVGAVVLVETMLFASVVPLLPSYADKFELSKTGAGVLTAAHPVGVFVGAVPSGLLATRWGVKPTLLFGLTLLGLASLGFAFADHIVLLDLARFVQGLSGACLWAAGMGWLISAAPIERRGETIGGAIGALVVGFMLGPALGGMASITSSELVFSSVAGVSAALAFWALSIPGVEVSLSPPSLQTLGALPRPVVLAAFWVVTLGAAFAGVLDVLVPLRMDALGATGAAIGALFVFAGAIEAAMSPLVGRFSDRAGRLGPIRAGVAGAAAAAVLMPLPGTAVLVAVALMLAVIALAGFWGPALAMFSDAAEAAGLDQSVAFALSNLGFAAGSLVGSGGGAALADATSDPVPYGLLAIACVVTLLALSAGRRHAAAGLTRVTERR